MILNKTPKPIHILIADDDSDDQMMLKEAFEANRLNAHLHFVNDGEELMAYLNKSLDPKNSSFPRPSLVLLDLNMPKKDGREALRDIKSNAQLKEIPIVALTTSKAEEDIARSYNLGVNSYISKPITFDALISIVGELAKYWFEIVELPPQGEK